MKQIIIAIVAISVVILTFLNCSERASENVNTKKNGYSKEGVARNLGILYYAVNPMNEMMNPETVEKFVTRNKSLLSEDSPTIRLAKRLGELLVINGVQALSNFNDHKAFETLISMGFDSDKAYQAVSGVGNGSVDLVIMGYELLWIAEVIPEAANGNWDAFNSTGTQSRQAVRQIWPMVKVPGGSELLDQIMGQFQPYVQEQIAMLAMIMLSND